MTKKLPISRLCAVVRSLTPHMPMTPSPPKKQESVVKRSIPQSSQMDVNLEALFDGGDPFARQNSTRSGR